MISTKQESTSATTDCNKTHRYLKTCATIKAFERLRILELP